MRVCISKIVRKSDTGFIVRCADVPAAKAYAAIQVQAGMSRAKLKVRKGKKTNFGYVQVTF